MSEIKRGASAIIWFEETQTGEKKILVGKESRYLSDFYANKNKFTDEDRDFLNAMENLNTEDLEYAKKVYGEQAEELENVIKTKQLFNDTRIQYDTPEKTNNGYRVHYRCLPDNFKKGVIKGGLDKETDNGNTKNTIMREIREEVGMNVDPNNVILIGTCEDYDVYSIKIPNKYIDIFKSAIESRKKRMSGEVYDLEFTTLSMIQSELNRYNSKSKCAINLFNNLFTNTPKLLGGKRKTSKRKTPKRKTKRNHKKH